jgi:hypothetical protein
MKPVHARRIALSLPLALSEATGRVEGLALLDPVTFSSTAAANAAVSAAALPPPNPDRGRASSSKNGPTDPMRRSASRARVAMREHHCM